MNTAFDLEKTVSALDSLAETIVRHPSATIRPATQPQALGTARESWNALLTQPELEIGKTLGQGGMGVVRVATQTSLGRPVAVKTVRADNASATAIDHLLREAWVHGSLEHPGIVPIYALSVDEAQRPVIVMKRIEGTAWSDIMHLPDQIEARFNTSNAFEWNLRVFLQICDTVHFAHSRGIVHRDIKPENVMIGEFGEVYLLDWGIAVSMKDDGTGRFPLAQDVHEIAGTPHYMAPEMLTSPVGKITPQTDVYLLGATLYEIVTGHPPHEGDSLVSIVYKVLHETPSLEGVPRELANILQHSMKPDADARFETAKQLRIAVQGYLQHHDSWVLMQDAQERSQALSQVIADAKGDPAWRAAIYQELGACRFGYEEAVRKWSDNVDARKGLQRTLETMVRYELDAGSPEAADALLAGMQSTNTALVDEVKRAVDARLKERARMSDLEAQAAELDPTVGQSSRVTVGVVLGALWTFAPLLRAIGAANPSLEGAYSHQLYWSIGLLVTCLSLFAWKRELLLGTRFNRGVAITALVVFLGNLLVEVTCFGTGVAASNAMVLHMPVWIAVTTMLAATIDKRMWPVPTGYLATLLISLQWPSLTWFALSAGNLVLTVTIVKAWGRWNDVCVPKRTRAILERGVHPLLRWHMRSSR